MARWLSNPRPSRSEALRKLIHMGAGLLAFALPDRPLATALVVLAGLVFNLLFFHRIGGRRVWRPHEHERGGSVGIVAYPAVVLLLIGIFRGRLEIAGAVWGLLAFGDGTASLAGLASGRGGALPWNRGKTWVGSAAYVVCGTVAATVLLGWTLARLEKPASWPFLALCAALTALVGAFVESLPQGLDDNLTVPPVTALVLLGLLESEGCWSRLEPRPLLIAAVVGALVNLAAAAAAYRLRAVDGPGAVAGWTIGTVIWTAQGWRGFLLLVAFVAAGTAATRLGWKRKEARQVAQEAGGRRSVRHAVANTGVAAAAAVFAIFTPHPELCLAAMAGAFATATGDTLSSELGQLWGGRPFLVTTLERVSRGTDGAVSPAGTLAGLAGSLGVAFLAWVAGLHGLSTVLPVALAGVLGNAADTGLGATLESRGLLDNEGVNFASTLVGALFAMAGVKVLG